MGSYSLVKSYPERDTFEQILSESARKGKELAGVELAPDLSSKFAVSSASTEAHILICLGSPKSHFEL